MYWSINRVHYILFWKRVRYFLTIYSFDTLIYTVRLVNLQSISRIKAWVSLHGNYKLIAEALRKSYLPTISNLTGSMPKSKTLSNGTIFCRRNVSCRDSLHKRGGYPYLKRHMNMPWEPANLRISIYIYIYIMKTSGMFI